MAARHRKTRLRRSTQYADHNIGFAWLRVIGAGTVVAEHSAALTDPSRVALLPDDWRLSFGYIALMGFFAMSGYQISDSWQRDPSWWRYLVKRALRLLPPLLVVVILTVFVIGPLFTGLPAAEYWSDEQTWRYLGLTPLLFTMQHGLPGVFSDNPYSWSVNGSLWTLPLEVVGYGIVLAFGLALSIGATRLLLLPLLAGLIVLDSKYQSSIDYLGDVGTVAEIPVGPLVTFMVPFVIGMLLHAYRDRIRLVPAVALGLLGLWLILHWTPADRYVLPFMAGYGAIVWAHHWPKRLEVDGKWVYGSYGLYIWAFPIQQMLIHAGLDSIGLLIVLAVPLAYIAGTLSWNLVEAPTQRLRRFLPKPRRLRPPPRMIDLELTQPIPRVGGAWLARPQAATRPRHR